jgi:hypothetical protein
MKGLSGKVGRHFGMLGILFGEFNHGCIQRGKLGLFGNSVALLVRGNFNFHL